MHHIRSLTLCTLVILVIASSAGTARAQTTAQTVATIKHLEAQWSDAEATGNAAFLEGFLMPDYRSVGVAGTVADKARIIAGALRPKSAAMRNLIENYSVLHHVGTKVVVHGNMAIVTFYSLALGDKRGLSSSDFLVNDNGQWRAIYSAHTGLRL